MVCQRSCLILLAAMASFAPGAASDLLFPDVIAVKVTPRGNNRFDFDVTMRSPYDTPKRYADAFRVTDGKGRVFGERVLLHDHADEQPFTRELSGIDIPPDVATGIVQGRDMQSGYGGRQVELRLPGR